MSLFAKKQPDVPRRRQDGVSSTPERATESSLSERYAFRRNRTITGSASSNVVSTNESNAQLKSSRVQAHDLAQQRQQLVGVLSVVLLGVVVLASLVFQFTAQVAVRTSDVSRSLAPEYATAVDDYLSRQPIERLRFLLREDALTDYLQSVTPEVESITSIGYGGLGKSVFVVEMRRPIAGWSIRGSQQYVDTSGVSFASNYYDKPQVQVVDNSGIQVEAGQAVASNQFLSFVGRVVGLANAKQYTVTQVTIPQGTTRQIELKMKDVAYPIKLSVDRPAGEQVEDMARSIAWLQSHKVTPQYLDVRVSGRAFYRLAG
jgi:cell division septal protein FtsQ